MQGRIQIPRVAGGKKFWVAAAVVSVPALVLTTVRVALAFTESAEEGWRSVMIVVALAAGAIVLVGLIWWLTIGRLSRALRRVRDTGRDRVLLAAWSPGFERHLRPLTGSVFKGRVVNFYALSVMPKHLEVWSLSGKQPALEIPGRALRDVSIGELRQFHRRVAVLRAVLDLDGDGREVTVEFPLSRGASGLAASAASELEEIRQEILDVR